MPSFLRLKRCGESVIITGTYNFAFVQALKSYVPYVSRTWESETKTWTVHASFEGQVLKAASGKFDAIHLEYHAENGDYVVRNIITGEEIVTTSLFENIEG